ncbi:HK97 gp10 family phage protein [Streptomyces alfalfae]|uniref:HK97-gp10 family putative phage morphogenesis protein n=1 Tax=Streptomyces alfalfae TaxID=1642299 RepID=UPI001BAA42BE|nr:HK97-gp10 family putative phage morphogenesis protein [Streptomyces alfalfae]QUI32436.1 HK97 gp10 family phage protein [Streptomyces alfalfae]
MARRSRLDGLGRALRAIERIPRAMEAARTEALHEWAEAVQTTAEEKVPRDEGDLWQSLDHRVLDQYGRAEVGVWDPEQLEYALYVETGTSSMADQPYLVPAFAEHRRQVVRTYRAAFRRHMGGGA